MASARSAPGGVNRSPETGLGQVRKVAYRAGETEGQIVMRQSRFSEQQSALVLRRVEDGWSIEEVCRKLGISQQTF